MDCLLFANDKTITAHLLVSGCLLSSRVLKGCHDLAHRVADIVIELVLVDLPSLQPPDVVLSDLR